MTRRACSPSSHGRIKADRAAFEQLDYVGVQEYPGRGYSIELRNCQCGSTLGVRIGCARGAEVER